MRLGLTHSSVLHPGLAAQTRTTTPRVAVAAALMVSLVVGLAAVTPAAPALAGTEIPQGAESNDGHTRLSTSCSDSRAWSVA